MSSHKKFAVFFVVISLVSVLACQSVSNFTPTPTVTSSTNVQNLEGTIWSGIDSGGKSFVYEFLPNGVLKFTVETGTFTDGSWKQDGKLIYFEMNNKYAEGEGVISDNLMTGNGWNQAGYKWTWTANKISASQISGANGTLESPSSGERYDGDWKGTTSQDLEVTFTVARNGIAKIKIQAKWDGEVAAGTPHVAFLNRARGFESRRGFQFPVITPDTDTELHGQSDVQKTARLARGSVML